MRFTEIIELEKVEAYLLERQVVGQYRKAKAYLLAGHAQKLDFKLRFPKENGVYQFRINQKYRAFGYFEGEEFFVFKISDHQDF